MSHASAGDQRLGRMQPLLTQVPPKRLRSMIATFIPAAANRTASGGPACPVPMMIASYMIAIRYLSPSLPHLAELMQATSLHISAIEMIPPTGSPIPALPLQSAHRAGSLF